MGSIGRIDHVALVVEDIEAALGFWRDALGLQVADVEEVPEQEAVVAFLPLGDSSIELVKPTQETSGTAKFLQKRGPGIHHICFEVDDIEATMQRLQDRGVRLINDHPVNGAGGTRVAFIHPSAAFGVLIELYQSPK
jgi:methylmalonyl-CoA/ethylmalonyl-CoA epimerase